MKRIIWEYVKNRRGEKVGVIAGSTEDNQIIIGWSRCNTKAGDVFDVFTAIDIAEDRAKGRVSTPALPPSMKSQMRTFQGRCLAYFQDAMFSCQLPMKAKEVKDFSCGGDCSCNENKSTAPVPEKEEPKKKFEHPKKKFKVGDKVVLTKNKFTSSPKGTICNVTSCGFSSTYWAPCYSVVTGDGEAYVVLENEIELAPKEEPKNSVESDEEPLKSILKCLGIHVYSV